MKQGKSSIKFKLATDRPGVVGYTSEVIHLPIPKRCGCGVTHLIAPIGARVCMDFNLWFECACKSTLVILKSHLRQQ